MPEEVNWGLIVHRLNSIAKNQEDFGDKLTLIEEKLTKLESIKLSIEDLKSWKESIQETVSKNDLKELRDWKKKCDDISSPLQLKQTLRDVENLKVFKTQSLMVWAVVQAIMLVLIFLEKFNIF